MQIHWRVETETRILEQDSGGKSARIHASIRAEWVPGMKALAYIVDRRERPRSSVWPTEDPPESRAM